MNRQRLWRALLASAGMLGLAACGSGAGDDEDDDPPPGTQTSWQQGVFLPYETFENKCANPGSGNDTELGQRYGSGSRTDENNFLRSWTNDLYLWYSEVPDVNPATYSDTLDYFDILQTSAVTASGNLKDRFHFTYPTPEWLALSQSGVSAGYGAQWVIIGEDPNRRIVVAYTEPNTAATTNNIARGTEIISVDGVNVATANTQAQIDTLNEGLFPSAAGSSHQFLVRDVNSPSNRAVNMVSASITSDPVQNVSFQDTLTGDRVGYLLFNDHIATSEAQLRDAVSSLQSQNIDDLVLDVRYNGGGYLAIASELAYMIAGSAQTGGETFERLQFNDKHPNTDPVTGEALTAMPFLTTANIDPAIRGQTLPTLNLSRVFLLTSGDTCSASESIINGLRGVDVEVIQIGSATCGKPYGFYPEDNCGTTYFSIQFRGINAKNFGDYADGFVPSTNPSASNQAQVQGCAVADDFQHSLGSPLEARFAAALQFQGNGGCPPASATLGQNKPGELGAVEGRTYKSPALTNRILVRPQ